MKVPNKSNSQIALQPPTRLVLIGIFLASAFLTACDNPLGSKSVSNPAVGDSANGGGGGNTNPAQCDAIAFASQLQATLSTAVDSETVTLAGCAEPVLVSVTGDGSPQIFKNGTLVSGSATVFTGDTLRVRLTTSALESTNSRATLAIGGASALFSVTTGDFTPGAFSFSPATGQALSANVTSNQATLAGFDGSLTATVTGAGSPVILVNGSVVGASASVSSGNAISVRLTSAATENTTRQATVTVGGVSAVFDVTTTGDATAPSLTSVSAPANGSYKQDQHLDFTANFTESVTVSGTPRFILNIGGATRYANYLSGSGTASLVFRYTVQASMNDSNGINIGSLQLNGGTIQDAASNSADLSFLAPDTALVLVDTTAPTVQSASGPASATYVPGQFLSFALTFNEAVTVTGTPRLTLTIGSTTRYADYLSGTGTSTVNFRYTVQAGDADADGIAVASPIDLNSGTIADVATNAATLTFTAPNTSGVLVTECPANYVPIQALAPYTTSFFCVAKYEMKNVGGVATSQASGTPWVSIPRGTLATTAGGAWKACRDLGHSSGSGYDLISNAQWQTIARNLEGVGWNWSSGTVGNSSGMSRGHSDNSPSNSLAASTDDNDSCTGTGQTCDLSTWSDQRRVHRLSSGSYLWDIAGNVWEWVQDNNSTNFGADGYISTITPVNRPNTGTIGGVLNNANYHFGPAGDYTGLSSSPYGGLGHGWLNYSAGAILRGGGWFNGVDTGVFSTYLGIGPAYTDAYIGFRCVWSP